MAMVEYSRTAAGRYARKGASSPYARTVWRLMLAWLVLATIGIALFGLLVMSGPAIAASPPYCAFYAREYVKQFDLGAEQADAIVEISDEAYYRCLNLDVAPNLPDLSAYAGSGFDAVDLSEPLLPQGDADPDEGLMEIVVDSSADGLREIVVDRAGGLEDISTRDPAIEEDRADATPEAAPDPDDSVVEVEEAAEPEPVRTASTREKSRSGLEPWTPEWRAWCRKHFPNSFDPETGYVVPFEGGRAFC